MAKEGNQTYVAMYYKKRLSPGSTNVVCHHPCIVHVATASNDMVLLSLYGRCLEMMGLDCDGNVSFILLLHAAGSYISSR